MSIDADDKRLYTVQSILTLKSYHTKLTEFMRLRYITSGERNHSYFNVAFVFMRN